MERSDTRHATLETRHARSPSLSRQANQAKRLDGGDQRPERCAPLWPSKLPSKAPKPKIEEAEKRALTARSRLAWEGEASRQGRRPKRQRRARAIPALMKVYKTLFPPSLLPLWLSASVARSRQRGGWELGAGHREPPAPSGSLAPLRGPQRAVEGPSGHPEVVPTLHGPPRPSEGPPRGSPELGSLVAALGERLGEVPDGRGRGQGGWSGLLQPLGARTRPPWAPPRRSNSILSRARLPHRTGPPSGERSFPETFIGAPRHELGTREPRREPWRRGRASPGGSRHRGWDAGRSGSTGPRRSRRTGSLQLYFPPTQQPTTVGLAQAPSDSPRRRRQKRRGGRGASRAWDALSRASRRPRTASRAFAVSGDP